MVSSGKLRRVAFVRTDVSDELSVSFFRVTSIGDKQPKHAEKKYQVPQKCLFLQAPHGITTQEMPFFLFQCFILADLNFVIKS
jgi:hypothetical protein